ncbi:hypothetical protein [Thermus antranikianii]|uniref:hypothetical protein n=1 Tax=Thermus antranikianii TaxID=88190 RepID=UPI001C77CE14|nr:hypothetical protein [Thermus antranikianii]QWK21010.1 MAG: hypothetical protein KNN15_08080 [Thermus antranikianii]
MGVGEEGFLYPIDRLLHERGFALHIPRPGTGEWMRRHRRPSKNLFAEVQRTRAEGRKVRLPAYDEHKLGLKPV